MKRWILPVALACAATCAVAFSAQANTDLIISEYVEGSSNNKAIEIWNHTGAAIDLTAGGYKLQIYFNGAVTPLNTIALTGVLADNDAYVVAHSSAVAGILSVADLATGSLSFNGDDAVVLVKSAANTTVDAFGQIGLDPGAEWGTGVQSTADNTIRRKPDVCDGDLNGTNLFDPTIEWDGFATDTFGGLGTHSDACGPVPAAPSSWGSVKSLYR
jgi:hypothetical protein